MLSSHLIKGVIITEKATLSEHASKSRKTYIFKVGLNANKAGIKKAIEDVFEVKVKAVNTLIQKGKQKITRGRVGFRKDFKKAYVTLETGYSINLEESM
jgi:large subunit ribosomal protein L23